MPEKPMGLREMVAAVRANPRPHIIEERHTKVSPEEHAAMNQRVAVAFAELDAKRGRKLIGDQKLSATERTRRHREKKARHLAAGEWLAIKITELVAAGGSVHEAANILREYEKMRDGA